MTNTYEDEIIDHLGAVAARGELDQAGHLSAALIAGVRALTHELRTANLIAYGNWLDGGDDTGQRDADVIRELDRVIRSRLRRESGDY